ncbi:hypothetical protein FIBSPDRAFT_171331 [Athelia psychrophila]|uniref:Uncharacterized protein n=1 Tax=Athelia psychrophila TaxID=1759441 RepID=A0A166ATP1_9AGAM|nr:hypothetical protein FIBSPDRAFT_171331 [Fibularhizoctonia sp. CBS 109695]
MDSREMGRMRRTSRRGAYLEAIIDTTATILDHPLNHPSHSRAYTHAPLTPSPSTLGVVAAWPFISRAHATPEPKFTRPRSLAHPTLTACMRPPYTYDCRGPRSCTTDPPTHRLHATDCPPTSGTFATAGTREAV